MFEDFKICPYTGLRPFTEEESIYFKGRDEHIEKATRQLEKNKFIMLTGASGDGKSSLVYAGIIPNAKAGFLKATFSNWSIVDFRPERSPLINLGRALAAQLEVNPDTVRTELGYGFSALVDMYKSSALYYNMQSAEWAAEDDKTKSEKKRKAANLIILADQFEEFFTNPENFENGIPSQEAMSVTNLLLETARIALEENLPVYVIVTMRSDFIGQCAAFRGLPEYIGFSQFFVPRLNRKELREVIEEPAALSGNTIARRLTERLIHDIVEGTDQLPILQHALNQIWKMADEGEGTMDLIHYAMVGGMQGDELPGDDVVKFNEWFAGLPENVQRCYDQPSLQNVLNTHANKLYTQDADRLRELHKGDVSDDDAKRVIKTAFKCLTKINNGRAVRNRMTLEEITAIIDVPYLDYKVVGRILDIFREPGNTLLRPFSEEVPELKEIDVLDITHESLIRNWENLEGWAQEEYNSYTISRDFGHQLNRWISSNKSDDFLLYIGPLTYFETWIRDDKPNAAWIARYLEGESDKATKLEKANVVQANAKEFLKRSGRKHILTRTVVRYGAGRIAAVLGLIVVLTLSSFLVADYWRRQDAYVLNDLKKKSLGFAGDKNIHLSYRAAALNEGIMQGDLTIPEIADAVKNPIDKINIVIGIASQLVYQGTNEPHREIMQILQLADTLLATYPLSYKNGTQLDLLLKEANDQSDVLELAYFYKPVPEIDSLRDRNAKRLATLIMGILQNEPVNFTNVNNFNRGLEHAINRHAFSALELDEMIRKLSPFGEGLVSPWVSSQFARDKLCSKGFYEVSFNFNGLYQELAYLFATRGNSHLALSAIDTLLTYNQNYFQNDYSALPDNAFHIAGVFYAYGHLRALDEFVAGYCQKTGTTEAQFYARLLGRCKTYEFATAALENDQQIDASFNLILEYSSDAQLDFFFTKYRDVLARTSKSPDERNFQTALSYKDQAIIHLRKLQVQGADTLNGKYLPLLDKAVALYRTVDSTLLNTKVAVVEISSNDDIVMPRKFQFLYPDIRTPFHPNEPRLYHFFYTTDAFIAYILDKDLFQELYPTEAELRYFELFLRDYHFVEVDVNYTASRRMLYPVMARLEKALASHPASRQVNRDFLFLYAGHEASLRNERERALYYFSQLTTDHLKALFFNSFNPGYTMSLVGIAVGDLAKFDYLDEADRVVKMFRLPVNRSTLYAYGAQGPLLENIKTHSIDRLIDSASLYMNKTKNINSAQSNRVHLAGALAFRDKPGDMEAANKRIKNVQYKYFGMGLIARALAVNGKTFEALDYITRNTSAAGNADFAMNILYGYNLRNGSLQEKSAWKTYSQNHAWIFNRPITYADEDN